MQFIHMTSRGVTMYMGGDDNVAGNHDRVHVDETGLNRGLGLNFSVNKGYGRPIHDISSVWSCKELPVLGCMRTEHGPRFTVSHENNAPV